MKLTNIPEGSPVGILPPLRGGSIFQNKRLRLFMKLTNIPEGGPVGILPPLRGDKSSKYSLLSPLTQT
ncbi:MAG: hypothetical protein ACI8WB_000416 [Phenylobacterium sp.]|jgi:hypothetical protein